LQDAGKKECYEEFFASIFEGAELGFLLGVGLPKRKSSAFRPAVFIPEIAIAAMKEVSFNPTILTPIHFVLTVKWHDDSIPNVALPEFTPTLTVVPICPLALRLSRYLLKVASAAVVMDAITPLPSTTQNASVTKTLRPRQ